MESNKLSLRGTPSGMRPNAINIHKSQLYKFPVFSNLLPALMKIAVGGDRGRYKHGTYSSGVCGTIKAVGKINIRIHKELTLNRRVLNLILIRILGADRRRRREAEVYTLYQTKTPCH